jgi:hypothetical protein
VHFITDPQDFPSMPRQLQQGAWAAAFLAEPDITAAGEQYGERVLADLDQGSAADFPIDGVRRHDGVGPRQHPKTAAAFVRAHRDRRT